MRTVLATPNTYSLTGPFRPPWHHLVPPAASLRQGQTVPQDSPANLAAREAAGPVASLVERPDTSRIRADYHVHTTFSYDSATPLDAALRRALTVGIRLLCVTDHNTIDGALALREMSGSQAEIVVGCEFTTADGSHLIGLGLTEMIFETNVAELVKRIHAQGGIVLLPHPFRRSTGMLRNGMHRSPAFVDELLASVDIVECFNGGDSYDNNRRNYALVAANGLAAVASSDAHVEADIGSVFVEYGGSSLPTHGVSPRRVFFAPRSARPEHALKRAVMEFYHEHEARMPDAVRTGYRLARQRLGTNRRRRARGVPSLQYEFGDHWVPDGSDEE